MTDLSPDAAGELTGEFPGWNVWVSSTGRWWAVFKAVLTAGQVSAGCLPLLHAEDSLRLAERIREQEIFRELHPAHRLISRTGDDDCPGWQPGRSQRS